MLKDLYTVVVITTNIIGWQGLRDIVMKTSSQLHLYIEVNVQISV
jgi:hypothetical protein